MMQAEGLIPSKSSITDPDIDRQGAELLLLVVSAKALKKGRANNMTMKEKIRIHQQIEQENQRKLQKWKEERK